MVYNMSMDKKKLIFLILNKNHTRQVSVEYVADSFETTESLFLTKDNCWTKAFTTAAEAVDCALKHTTPLKDDFFILKGQGVMATIKKNKYATELMVSHEWIQYYAFNSPEQALKHFVDEYILRRYVGIIHDK